MENNMTRENIEAEAERFAVWAESDDFFDALETARIVERSEDTSPKAQELMAALKRGRPARKTDLVSKGSSPVLQLRVPEELKELLRQRSIQERKTQSEVARDALARYLMA